MDWKTRVSDAINFYWDQETRKEASTKTSLKYLNIDALEIAQSILYGEPFQQTQGKLRWQL